MRILHLRFSSSTNIRFDLVFILSVSSCFSFFLVFSVTAFYVPSFSASPAAHPSTQSGFVTFYGLGSDPYFLAASGGPKQLEVVTPSDLRLKSMHFSFLFFLCLDLLVGAPCSSIIVIINLIISIFCV